MTRIEKDDTPWYKYGGGVHDGCIGYGKSSTAKDKGITQCCDLPYLSQYEPKDDLMPFLLGDTDIKGGPWW